MATQYARDGILINAINPGWVNTEMARKRIQDMAEEEGGTYESMLEAQKQYVPTGKFSEPEEIAALVQFLFSNAQTSMTGQAIDINGGAWMGQPFKRIIDKIDPHPRSLIIKSLGHKKAPHKRGFLYIVYSILSKQYRMLLRR